MLNAASANLKKPLFESWLIVIPAVVLTALAVNFAPALIAISIGLALFSYFWHHKNNLIIFLIVYTPVEEVILKALPDSLYAPVRFMWEGMLFAIIGLMILENVILNKSWKTSIIDKFVMLFITGWLLSGFINDIPLFVSLFHIKNLIRYIALFYIVYNLKPDINFLKKILFTLITIGIFQSFICIAQAIEGDLLIRIFRPRDVVVGSDFIRGADIQTGSYHTRFTGTFARANDLGNYLAFVLCFLVAAYFKLGKKQKYLIALIPILSALLLSSSRISWISLFLAIGFILFKIKHRVRYVYFIAPIVFILILITGFVAMDYENIYGDFDIFGRFIYMFTSDFIENISAHGRLYVILNTVPAVFSASPVFGLGPGSFMNIAQFLSNDNTFARANVLGLETKALYQVHDVGYAALFIQVGFIGLIPLILIFIMLYKKASQIFRKSDNPLVQALLLGSMGFFICIAVQNLACFNLMYRNQSLVIWVICGLVALFTAVEPGKYDSNRNDNILRN